jgi:hypothetical protein
LVKYHIFSTARPSGQALWGRKTEVFSGKLKYIAPSGPSGYESKFGQVNQNLQVSI